MSVAFLISSPSRFRFNHYTMMSKNLGKDLVKLPSCLKIEVNQPKSRILKSLHRALCQCCFGFSPFDEKSCASAGINLDNIRGTADYEKMNGLENNQALEIVESVTSFGSGGGEGNEGGGWTSIGDNDGNSYGWEKAKLWCWWLLDAWKDHHLLAHQSSASSVLIISRLVMPIVEDIVGCDAQDMETILMQLLMSIYCPMLLIIPVAAFYGFAATIAVAIEQMFLLFAAGVLGFALVLMFYLLKYSI